MILIRADANEQIGTGHVMRCLSVAYALAKRELNVTFVTADHRGDRLIQQNGFSSICLNTEWTNMDEEINAIERTIEEMKPVLLLIDSYYVTEKYMSSVSKLVKTAYFDDMNKTCWDTDVLINYNIFSSVFDYTGYNETRTKLLLGPKYAPLREEFFNCPKHEIKEVTDILVSAGGSDPEHITEKIMDNICFNYPNLIFHFIVGALNPRLGTINNIASEEKNAILHINEQHMSDLMEKCDIAISAAGTTLYELCACGIPTITYTLADNQLVAAEQFEKQGIMFYAGDCRNNTIFVEGLMRDFDYLIAEKNKRKKLSEIMQTMVDGRGSERIINELLI